MDTTAFRDSVFVLSFTAQKLHDLYPARFNLEDAFRLRALARVQILDALRALDFTPGDHEPAREIPRRTTDIPGLPPGVEFPRL